jgi:putative membrane protein
MNSRDWTIVLLVILGVVVLLPVLGMSFWGGGMMGPGGMMGRGMMGGWGPGPGFVGGFGGGFGLLFLLLVIAGVVLIVSGLTRRDVKGTTSDEPLQILRARLARGEITKEEFEDLKEALK